MVAVSTVLAGIGALSSAAGSATQAAGFELQAASARASAQTALSIAILNQQSSESEALLIERNALIQAEEVERDGIRLLSTQSAQFGKGLVTMQGSPLLVLAETAFDTERDKNLVLIAGKNEAEVARFRGRIAKFQGQSLANSLLFEAGSADLARDAAQISTGTTLLTGGIEFAQGI